MRRQQVLAIGWFVFLLGGAANLFLFHGTAVAQSDVVFMTADDFNLPGRSRLYRFDSGAPSFAVYTGANAGFQGVTTLGSNVLVADYIGEKIQRFSPDGTYLGPFASVVDAA